MRDFGWWTVHPKMSFKTNLLNWEFHSTAPGLDPLYILNETDVTGIGTQPALRHLSDYEIFSKNAKKIKSVVIVLKSWYSIMQKPSMNICPFRQFCATAGSQLLCCIWIAAMSYNWILHWVGCKWFSGLPWLVRTDFTQFGSKRGLSLLVFW